MPRTLSEEEWHKAAEKINAAAKNPEDPCPVCGADSALLPTVVDIPGGPGPEGEITIPAITTICDKCGLIRHFSSIVLGIDGRDGDA